MRLDPATLDALEAAATEGRTFTVDVLRLVEEVRWYRAAFYPPIPQLQVSDGELRPAPTADRVSGGE